MWFWLSLLISVRTSLISDRISVRTLMISDRISDISPLTSSIRLSIRFSKRSPCCRNSSFCLSIRLSSALCDRTRRRFVQWNPQQPLAQGLCVMATMCWSPSISPPFVPSPLNKTSVMLRNVCWFSHGNVNTTEICFAQLKVWANTLITVPQ